jgi:hypothetical protein
VGGRGKKAAKILTALNLAQAPAVAATLSAFAEELTVQVSKHKAKLWSALQRTAAFEQFTLWDIVQLCAELEKEGLSTPSATALQQMMAVQEGGFVVGSQSNDARLAACGGVSIYIPAPPETDLSRYYSKLAFAQETHWLGFLKAVKQN